MRRRHCRQKGIRPPLAIYLSCYAYTQLGPMAISRWTVVSCMAASLTAFAISTRLLPFHQAYREHRASPGHRESFAISVVAPKQHRGLQENYSLLIPARRFQSNVSDEEILARFTKGFFSGLVFTPERWLLKDVPFRITDIPGNRIYTPYMYYQPKSKTC